MRSVCKEWGGRGSGLNHSYYYFLYYNGGVGTS
jgi:hypothetical protein